MKPNHRSLLPIGQVGVRWALLACVAAGCGTGTENADDTAGGGTEESPEDGSTPQTDDDETAADDGSSDSETQAPDDDASDPAMDDDRADDDESGGAAEGPSAAEFCTRWVEEFAALLERCGCSSEVTAEYRETATALCDPDGFFAELAAAVERGDLAYDAEAAEALFARLGESDARCLDEPFRALGLDSIEVYSMGGVFVGTHELGSPCTLPVTYKGGVSDCREGVCASDGAEGGVCIALVGVGAECDESGDENLKASIGRLCHDVRPADSDGEYESAFDSLSCLAATEDSAMRVCVQAIEDGQPCQHSNACLSGHCEDLSEETAGTCASRLTDGEPCAVHRECTNGVCLPGETRVCGVALADGEPCNRDDGACQSGFCRNADGTEETCGPAPDRAIGESCASSDDCISEGSGESRTLTCQDGVCVGDICGG